MKANEIVLRHTSTIVGGIKEFFIEYAIFAKFAHNNRHQNTLVKENLNCFLNEQTKISKQTQRTIMTGK